MKPVVFFSINDGLFFWNGHHGLMVDYVFDNSAAPWSDMPDTTYRRMLEHSGEFSREHTLLFTHGHTDHYSPRHMEEYVKRYSSGIYGPGIPESNLVPRELAPGMALLTLPGYRVLVIRTKHQGRGNFSKIDNSALCIETEGLWYIHCGDSVLDSALLIELDRRGVHTPEAVFANYYHIVPEGQRELLRNLNARHIFGIHFPFPNDHDKYDIKRRLVRFLNNAADPFLKEIIVPEPMGRVL